MKNQGYHVPHLMPFHNIKEAENFGEFKVENCIIKNVRAGFLPKRDKRFHHRLAHMSWPLSSNPGRSTSSPAFAPIT